MDNKIEINFIILMLKYQFEDDKEVKMLCP